MPNLFQQAKTAIVNFFSRQPQSLSRLFVATTTEVYPDPGAQTGIDRGFKSNAAFYSIVKRAAKKFGAIPRYVEPIGQEGKSESEVIKGPLMDLLNRPNPLEGQDAFYSKIYGYFKTVGEGMIWLNRGDTDTLVDDVLTPIDDEAHSRKPVLEMYNLPSQRVVLIPDPEDINGILGWQLLDNPSIKFRKVDIIQWKDLSLDWDLTTRSHMRGFPAASPGNKILETNNSATNATVRMNQNGGAKVALAEKTLGSTRNAVQQSQLEKVFETKINNNDVKGAVAGLQGDWSVLELGLSSIDMDLLKGKQLSMQELCFLMGMPYEFFDSQVTYANKQEAQKGWIINEIMPDCKQLDGEMSRVLCKAFGLENTATICSDFDDLPELQEDKKSQIEWLMKGPFTVDEIREATGYEPIGGEDGDKVIIPSGFQFLDDLSGDGGEEMIRQLANGKMLMNGVKKPAASNGVRK